MDNERMLKLNPDANIIPPEELDILRIKMGKSKRKEADWDVIKDILNRHDLIVMEPEKKDRRYRVYDHVMSVDGVLVAFTNVEDCMKHVRWLNDEDGVPGRRFVVGTMPFEQVISVAEHYRRDLLIDAVMDSRSRCLMYLPATHEIKAVSMLR